MPRPASARRQNQAPPPVEIPTQREGHEEKYDAETSKSLPDSQRRNDEASEDSISKDVNHALNLLELWNSKSPKKQPLAKSPRPANNRSPYKVSPRSFKPNVESTSQNFASWENEGSSPLRSAGFPSRGGVISEETGRTGSTDRLRVEDHLMVRHQAVKEKIDEMREEIHHDECPHKPKISKKSETIVRGLGLINVHERLYRAKKKPIIEPPPPTTHKKSTRSTQKLLKSLYDDAIRHKNSTIQKVTKERIDFELAQISAPKVNKKSEQIVKGMKESAFDRLTMPKRKPEVPPVNYTFHPKVTNAKPVDRGHVFSRLYKNAVKGKKKKEMIIKMRKREEEQRVKKQNAAVEKKFGKITQTKFKSVLKRMRQRDEASRMRLLTQRKKTMDADGCTFQPDITQSSPQKLVKLRGNAVGRHELGEHNHLRRQQAAREFKQWKEEAAFADGSGWTPTLTKPEPFKLSDPKKQTTRTPLEDQVQETYQVLHAFARQAPPPQDLRDTEVLIQITPRDFSYTPAPDAT